MGNISNILVRMRELAVQAANGTLGDDDRAAIQTEVTALVEQIDDIAERTTFNGTDLLTGDATTPTDPVTISIQTGVNDRSEERRVGKEVSGRVDLGGSGIIKKKKNKKNETERTRE